MKKKAFFHPHLVDINVWVENKAETISRKREQKTTLSIQLSRRLHWYSSKNLKTSSAITSRGILLRLSNIFFLKKNSTRRKTFRFERKERKLSPRIFGKLVFFHGFFCERSSHPQLLILIVFFVVFLLTPSTSFLLSLLTHKDES